MKQLNPIQWLTALVLVAPLAASAQRPADLRKSGDFYYNTGDYYSAASYYQQYLDGGRSGAPAEGGFRPYAVSLKRPSKGAAASGAVGETEIRYRLAESYRRLNDWGHAVKLYEDVVKSKDGASYPEARYGYAVALRAQGNAAEAKTQFTQYLQTPGARNATAAQAELNSIAFATSAPAPDPMVKVGRMADPVNGAETNYAGSWSGGQMIFTSTRPDTSIKNSKVNPYVNGLYASSNGSVQKLPLATDGSEQGAASMTADGNRIYFTRWSYDRGVPQSSIWVSQKNGSGWSEPVKMGAPVNADGSNARQPHVTADGRYLLFASDRAGGQGGWDIWMTPLTASGEPGVAVNAGAGVNTAEEEATPFYHAPSQTLVFASRGRAGFGGLDLFAAKGAPGAAFGAAENMGVPVNSVKDDSYFSTNSTDRLLKGAVVSSDRGNDNCLSLYQIDKQYRQYVAGVVKDCSNDGPLGNAQVTIAGRTATTAADGAFLVEVPSLQAGSGSATREGYIDGSIAVPAPERADLDTLRNVTACLVPKPTEPPVAEAPAADNTVFFDFAKYSLRPETAVTLDTLAAILKREPSLRLIVTGYTDQVGTDEYNAKLSRERADACRDYLLRKGVAAGRVQAIGKGACCPVKPEKTADGKDDPAARQANRRVEFDIKLNR